MAGTIAFDATAVGQSDASTSMTFSHTCTGTNRLLIVFSFQEQTTSCSFTYNGVAMTEIPTNSPISGATKQLRMFYLIAPATGANNVVGTKGGGSGEWDARSVSYTGVNQSGIPDASINKNQVSGTSLVTTLTTILQNCWTVIGVLANGGSLAASTGSTIRGSVVRNGGVFDSNNGLSIGSNSMTQTMSTGDSTSIMISIPSVYSTISVNDTSTLSDVISLFTGFRIIVSDTLSGILDTIRTAFGWNNTSKNDSSWTNQSKS